MSPPLIFRGAPKKEGRAPKKGEGAPKKGEERRKNGQKSGKGEKGGGKEGKMGKIGGNRGKRGKIGENEGGQNGKRGRRFSGGWAKKRGAKMYRRGADLVGNLSPPFSKSWLRPWPYFESKHQWPNFGA